MAYSSKAAMGYKDNSSSIQKVGGELFIEADVCPKAGDVILDLGCGTGELSAFLAKLVGDEGKVVGVDPDKQRIDLAQQSHREVQNLSFVEGSDSNFPGIGFETYDIIFSNCVLHWIPDKQQTFKNMFASLKKEGKLAFQFGDCMPRFMFRAFNLLNPENAERICGKMFQYEPKAKVEQYCTLSGFTIVKSYEFQLTQFDFKNMEHLLKWLWASTHGVFDPSLVTKERLQGYLVLYFDAENGKPCLDFRGVKEETTVCRLVAAKPASEIN